MPNVLVVKLMEEVAMLRTDMEWIKKGIYMCIGTSLAACLSVIGEIAVKVMVK